MYKSLKDIKSQGYTILKKVINKKQCEDLVKELNKITKIRLKKNEYVGNNEYLILHNYFTYKSSFLNLLCLKKVNEILNKVIDEDYVLISSSARNRFKNDLVKKKIRATGGLGWHTDTRYLQGKKMNPSLRYLVIIALEDFNKFNASTLIIPRSHKKNNRPLRDKNYKNSKKIFLEKGSVVIFDSALWHKAGDPTENSRWAIFSSYGPWYFKPYFQFDKIMAKSYKNLTKLQKKIFHFNTTPPTKFNSSDIATLRKI